MLSTPVNWIEKINSNSSLIEQERDLDILREQAIYLLSINIFIGHGTRQLKWNHLGLSSETVKALQAAKSSPPSLRIFEGLQKKGNRLKGMRDRIQSRYMLHSKPYWFVRESDIEAIAEEISLLRIACECLKTEALVEYNSEFQSFLDGIDAILKTTSLSSDEQQALLDVYRGYFPTQGSVAQDFRVEVQGPIRVPSIREQSEHDAILAETELRRKEAHALQQLQTEYARTVQAKLVEAINAARDEFYVILAENVLQLEQVSNEDLTDRRKLSLTLAVERVYRLVDFDSSLESLASQFSAIVLSAQAPSQHQLMSAAIRQLRYRLRDDIESIRQSSARGHRAIAQWIL